MIILFLHIRSLQVGPISAPLEGFIRPLVMSHDVLLVNIAKTSICGEFSKAFMVIL